MRRTFYSWLMTNKKVNNADEVQEFANRAFYDPDFPKQSKDFEEISLYLEMNVSYLNNLNVFDKAWEQYKYSE